ncbi:MAG TPA: hypothetical protein VLB27_07535 [candidate division Zixibacteria bacterium]|nr:hypothetical protein [candidate division Zixibacteria bacterium]
MSAPHPTTPPNPAPARPRATLALLCALALAALWPVFTTDAQDANPDRPSRFDQFREYFYQPRLEEITKTLTRHDSALGEILRQRTALLWGADAALYYPALAQMDYEGLYQKDSTFIQRRAVWRSGLFATDVDFVEVSAYSLDGRVSLREMYALNRTDQRWAVVDSANFPLFERIQTVTDQEMTSRAGLRDFLLTLLSYAGYGSFVTLGTADTVYHGINLTEALGEEYYPYNREDFGDSSRVRFTACLRGGVDVTRWTFLFLGGSVLIEESEQLISVLDLPEEETAPAGEAEDTSAIAGLLTDVVPPRDSLTGAAAVLAREGEAPPPANTPDSGAPPVTAPGGVRLADLLTGAADASPQGMVSYEILEFTPVMPVDSGRAVTAPEFVNFIQPEYPIIGLRQGLVDEVELKIRIDTLGKARQALVSKRAEHPDAGFEVNAKRAAIESSFRPGTIDSVKVDMWLTYRLTFRLGGSQTTAPTPAPAVDSARSDTTKLDSLPGDTTKPDTTQSDSAVAPATDSLQTHTLTSDTSTSDSAEEND